MACGVDVQFGAAPADGLELNTFNNEYAAGIPACQHF
jgi:hypothetical protein